MVFGVEVRVVDGDGHVAPRDGTSVGEFEVRGPWVTASYYGDETPERFHDGWLRTGDVGTLDDLGYMTITDRTKDVIKTGGEWISSVELENALMGHPDVFEAAVVAVPDERWDERPLACIVLMDGIEPTRERLGELAEYLGRHVARWWVPERWAFVEEVPKTSVGKFDKKVIRAGLAKGELDVVTIERPGLGREDGRAPSRGAGAGGGPAHRATGRRRHGAAAGRPRRARCRGGCPGHEAGPADRPGPGLAPEGLPPAA